MREVERPGELARAESVIARVLLAIAGLAFAACLWEIDAPFGAGHHTAASALGVTGENMWRLGTPLPVPHHPFGPLTASDYLSPSIPEPLWKPGYVYGSVTEILRRPGHEVYPGRWQDVSRALPTHLGDEGKPVTLLELR